MYPFLFKYSVTTINNMSKTKYELRYSNASQLLGMDITFSDTRKGVIEANFHTQESFLNFAGNIHGGILVAMLDDLMGYALGITLPESQFAPTANLNVSFIR